MPPTAGHSKAQILARIADAWLIAVVRAETDEQARRIADALAAGGVTIIEITYTCPDPTAIIRALARDAAGDLVVGAGTVCDRASARAAIDAGARFIVSPGLVEEVVTEARAHGVVAIPGAATPTEILAALRLGADAVKLFPGSLFGPSYLKALRGPLPQLKAVPTGGVTLDNLKDWKDAGVLAVGIGTELMPKDAVAAGNYDVVTARAREFVKAALKLR